MWYTIIAIRKETEDVRWRTCRSGEIGRRPGLKIPWDESLVPVRARFPAPLYIAEWSSLVARRAHNPKVMWFKSHLRNHFYPVKPWFYGSFLLPGRWRWPRFDPWNWGGILNNNEYLCRNRAYLQAKYAALGRCLLYIYSRYSYLLAHWIAIYFRL